jgi:formate hydrogenlyase subunit 3/multisubunit Na+/H+ antiporter MnhD subunit
VTLLQHVLASAALLFALGVVTVGAHRLRGWNAVVYASTCVVSIALVAGAVRFLLGSTAPATTSLPIGLPWLNAHFAVDALSSGFLAVVGLGGSLASIYALGYGRHESSPGRVLPFFPMFLGAMMLVLVAADAFSFLFCWELMSLSSWALVIAHHREDDNLRAGYLSLVMAGIGTFTLLLAMGLLAGPDASYTFADIRSTGQSAGPAGVVFCLALAGTGSKAGLIPMHAWLPLAHPAAPSHVSALLSGVMTKVAVYAFVRIVFDLLGDPAPWWAMVVLAVAGPTAVLGVLYALMQRDLKRLLAYSTVENLGIVFIGLGLALAFEAYAMPAAAALAFVAALLHVLNHSLFKSLLFFGAGAVVSATGQRDMERLGGLIHGMPVTAVTFLVGAAAISALPPLNGFVSEWLTFQAILLSPELPDWGLKLMVPAVGALLALSAAFAAACFVKAFGVTFLGRPRSADAATAAEVDVPSLVAMGLLVLLCALAGVFPGTVIDAVAPIARQLLGASMPLQAEESWFTVVPIADTRSSYNGLLLLTFIVAASSLVAMFIHRFATRALRRAPPWDCGYPDSSPATQYSGVSFAQPIRRVFGSVIFAARERVDMPAPGEARPASIEVTLVDPVWETFYAPVEQGVDRVTERLGVLQLLSIRQYLGLVFLTLVGLLVVLAAWT